MLGPGALPRPGRLPFCYMLCSALFLLSVCGFLVDRLNRYMHELHRLRKHRDAEQWLLTQCQDSHFYHHMAHHSSLCEEVELHRDENIHLEALNHVFQSTYLCGYQPCVEFVEGVLNWLFSHGFYSSVTVGTLLFLSPTLVVPLWRLLRSREARLRTYHLYTNQNHHAPYSRHAKLL